MLIFAILAESTIQADAFAPALIPIAKFVAGSLLLAAGMQVASDPEGFTAVAVDFFSKLSTGFQYRMEQIYNSGDDSFSLTESELTEFNDAYNSYFLDADGNFIDSAVKIDVDSFGTTYEFPFDIDLSVGEVFYYPTIPVSIEFTSRSGYISRFLVTNLANGASVSYAYRYTLDLMSPGYPYFSNSQKSILSIPLKTHQSPDYQQNLGGAITTGRGAIYFENTGDINIDGRKITDLNVTTNVVTFDDDTTYTLPQSPLIYIFDGVADGIPLDMHTDYAPTGGIPLTPAQTIYIYPQPSETYTPENARTGDYPAIEVPTTGEYTGVLGNIRSMLGSIASGITAVKVATADLLNTSDFDINFDALHVPLTDKFPFCIPFDFGKLVTMFSAQPADFQFRINVETSLWTVDHTVDLSPFMLPILFFRYVVTAMFVWILISRTRDFIKW